MISINGPTVLCSIIEGMPPNYSVSMAGLKARLHGLLSAKEFMTLPNDVNWAIA